MTRGFRLGTLVMLWLVPVLIFAFALSWDWLGTWREFRLPSALPSFLDLHGIPAGVETLRAGGDPLDTNPTDPKRRPLNYPRAWLYLFEALGVTQKNVAIAALAFCAFYLTCMSYLIIQAQHWADMVVLLVASLSLAPLLAMERGNTDLFIFSLVFLGCVASNKNLKSWILAAATLLKIYPVATMGVDAIRRPGKEKSVPYALIAAVAFLFVLQWYDILLIAINTPYSRFTSYGVIALREHLIYLDAKWGYLDGLGWLVIGECWTAGALAVAIAWRKCKEMQSSVRNSRFAEMFSVFGSMYLFTYSLGSNSDYRLILLLPTIPLALEMIRIPRHRLWGVAHLIMVGVSLNAFGFNQGTGHLAEFCLFLSLCAFLTVQFKEFLPKREPLGLAEAAPN
jgi:hypothetical protein